jgi:cupin domain
MSVPEAPLEQTEHGLVCKGPGWFVVNARDVRWRVSEGWGRFSNFGGDTLFDQLGVGIAVLGPGEPMSMYHWETDQEDFLVLSGSGTLVIEGEERPLRQWDFVHCPPRTAHTIVGGPIVVFGVGARERHTMLDENGQRVGRDDGGEYVADPVAARYGASSPVTTIDSEVAYARFPPRELTRYGGWLE